MAGHDAADPWRVDTRVSTREHKDVDGRLEGEKQREFMTALLDDVRALEYMLQHKLFESDVRRIGAEQEMFLLDDGWRPARGVMAVLERLHGNPHFTTELGQFQLEANCDPQLLTGDGIGLMHEQLDKLVDKARGAAKELGLGVVLMGILPTMTKGDLGLDAMVPSARATCSSTRSSPRCAAGSSRSRSRASTS